MPGMPHRKPRRMVWRQKRQYGEIYYADGDIYVGEYILNKKGQKVRDGWGADITSQGERYEGEWCHDLRHGLGILTLANTQRAPCLQLSERDRRLENELRSNYRENFIVAERFSGVFLRGFRKKGVSATNCGMLVQEEWYVKDGLSYLLDRVPLFLASGLFNPEAAPTAAPTAAQTAAQTEEESALEEERRLNERIRKIKMSRVTSMPRWSISEVQHLCACMGMGLAMLCRIEIQRIHGNGLLELASPDARGLVQELFPEESKKSCGSLPHFPGCSARHRLLVVNVDFFRRALHKASEPRLSEAELRRDFQEMEIQREKLDLKDYVGEGGFGRVYCGITKNMYIAAKSVEHREKKSDGQPEISDSRKVPHSFYVELVILRRLRHPNIPVLLGVNLAENIIVMELVPGLSLYDLLHSRKRRSFLSLYRKCDFRYQDVLHVAREVCSGMAYVHAHNVVHCDIKTMNVLVANHEPAKDAVTCWGTWSANQHHSYFPLDVKICDFGLAQHLDNPADPASTLVLPDEEGDFYRKTVHAGCLGTYQYMAPEVLRCEGYSKASDVYSFGMVLWEMIAKQIPFQEYTAFQTMASVGYGRQIPQPPDPCPASLRQLLYSALRMEPADRTPFLDLAMTCSKLQSSRACEMESYWYWLAMV